MEFGQMIKRSWTITWRYKALWVLGVFAGISGCQPSGGNSGGSRSNYNFGSGSGAGGSGVQDPSIAFRQFAERATDWLPALVVVSILFFVIAIVWAIFGIAARGGLVVAVNELEEGREHKLRELWRAGFDRFGALVVLDILLKLPLVVLAMVVVFAAFIPLISLIAAGSEPSAMMFAPLCGALGLGLPALFVLSIVFGTMYLIALRYVMLGGQKGTEAAANSWRFIRARFKDTALTYLVSGGLNLAASFVLAIPAAIIGVAVAIPLVASIAGGGSWMAAVPAIGVALLLLMVLGFAYSGIWGTFTSSFWTLFFRKVTGMAPAAPAVAVAYQPQAPAGYPQPPVAPAPPNLPDTVQPQPAPPASYTPQEPPTDV